MPSLRADGCVPFTVTASLQQGAGLDARFGIALDGLLASQLREAAKRSHGDPGAPVPGSLLDGGLAPDDPTEVDLPLARCPGDGADQWHWLATTAYPVDWDGQMVTGDPDVHHVTSRVDERLVAAVATRMPASLPPTSGRYRMRRLPVVTLPAAALVWRGVGDPDRVMSLLAPVVSVGTKRTAGEGRVLRWEITVDASGDPDVFGHLHPAGEPGRPMPPACAHRLGVPSDREGVAGLRPPYWHRARQHRLVLPVPLQGGD